MTVDTPTAGIYTLAIELPETRTIDVGALGTITFDRDWYAYTGSAHGPGGFARVDRHRDLARGEREGRHWHIDYLLADDASRLVGVGRTPESDRECATAEAISGRPVPEFGASDCDCPSHLFATRDRESLVETIRAQHDEFETDVDPDRSSTR